jgi:hypothetical protein
MMISNRLILIFALISLLNKVKSDNFHNEFTREWAVKVSDPYNADLIALETGFENKGLVIISFLEFFNSNF